MHDSFSKARRAVSSNKNFYKFEDLFLWMFSEIYRFKKNIFVNMKILKFMFEGPVPNNKEKINIDPSPPGTPLAKSILLNFFEQYIDI